MNRQQMSRAGSYWNECYLRHLCFLLPAFWILASDMNSIAQDNQQQSARVIKGTVQDQLGRPVVNATIEWGPFLTTRQRVATKSNMHGAFEFEVKEVGKDFRLGVYAKGHAPAWVDGRIPQKGKPLTVDFKLSKSRFISGVVYSKSDNRPIANAEVTAETASYGLLSSFSSPVPPTPFPGPPRVVKTDEHGRFRIEDLGDNRLSLKKGTITLKVVATGFRQHYGDTKLSDKTLIYLTGSTPQGPGIIRLQVVDQETGLPISNFTVGKRYTTSVQHVQSKSGLYEEKQKAAGKSQHRFVYAVGYEPHLAKVKSYPAKEMKVAKIRLKKSQPLAGRVIDEATGKPVAGVKMVCALSGRYFPWNDFDTLHDGFHPLKLVQRGVTDRNGLFEFAEGADPNHLFLMPTSSHCRKIIRPTQRGKKDTSGRITISLAPAATISGQYKRDGQALAGSQIRLWKHQATSPEENWETITADPNGKFKFDHLEEGTYSISGYATRKFQLKKGQPLRIDLGGNLGPHELTGNAAPFLRIFLRPQIKDWDYTQFEAKADADGNYKIKGLKSGDYAVQLMYYSESTGTFLDAQTSIKIGKTQKHDFNQFKRFAN